MEMNVAEQVVKVLEESGVKRIYAVTGDSLNGINEAVRKSDKIEWIHVRHEETGAFAAGAEAQLSGGLACCAGSSGPGYVHLINGLYDSHRSGSAVLAIASTIPTKQFGTEYFQETHTTKLFDDCSYYNEVATTPYQLPRMLQSAIQSSLSRKGVSVVGIPGDLTGEATENINSSSINYVTDARVCPAREELEILARLLNESTKITLFCGIGCKEAHAEVVELSQRLNAPVVYTFKGKMSIQYENPNEVGMTGLLGMPSGYYSMHEAEVLLMLGTDFPYDAFMPDNVWTAQIDIRSERLERRAKVDLGLCGDIKSTLKELLPMLEQKSDDSFLQEHLKSYNKVRKNLESFAKQKGEKDNIQSEYVISLVNRLASENSVFTVDTGMTCVWGARYLHASGDRQMIGSFNHGSMANALPQAIGSSLLYKERQVIALCGDGGLSMRLGDLETIVQYKLPVKIIVFNNRSLGMVKLEMAVTGLTDTETDMLNPDFAQVSQAMGMERINVRDPEEVEPVLKRALAREGAVLVNIFTDPNALAMPPKVEIGQMTGFAQSMFKLMIHGRTKDVLDTIQMNYRHMKEIFK
ncbi:MAG: thiamine pyrophosphate-dependent enzyme [Bacteroides sp.]|nr:thiamine pyrophosphate-dependent enzyme [Bacteroides sp.]